MAVSIYIDEQMQSAGQMIKTQEWKELEKKHEFWGKDLIFEVYQDGKLLGHKKVKNSFYSLGKNLGAKSSGLFGLGGCKNIKAHFCNAKPWSAKLELRGSNLLHSHSYLFIGHCNVKVEYIDFDKFYAWADRIGFKKENYCDLSLAQFQNLVVNLFVKKVWETSIMNFDLTTKLWTVGLDPKEYPDFFKDFNQRVINNISNMGITATFEMVYDLKK